MQLRTLLALVIALALLASACGGSESDSSDQSAAVDDTAATDAGDAMADDESMSEDSMADDELMAEEADDAPTEPEPTPLPLEGLPEGVLREFGSPPAVPEGDLDPELLSAVDTLLADHPDLELIIMPFVPGSEDDVANLPAAPDPFDNDDAKIPVGHAYDPDIANLGADLFRDVQLSANKMMSCATSAMLRSSRRSRSTRTRQ